MINLIPMPEKVKQGKGSFSIPRKDIPVKVDERLVGIKDILEIILKVTVKEDADAALQFIYDDNQDENSYSLKISEGDIKIYAKAYEGAFYAVTTLRQLLLSDIESDTLSADCIEIINDKPEYNWRGLHLDESRHFFGKETVKKLLDFMSLYKLNRFHWHLTDDQGWRIEIKKYPLLTEIGSIRKGSQLHSWSSEEMDDIVICGYYTQQDIREIVEYAKQRCIEIIPEIDFPAHSAAAIASYNYLACREIPCEVLNYFGDTIPKKNGIKDWNRTLCLGKDKVIDFVFDVIDEVAELFPFEYFHVGGDEAPLTEWKKCPLCQQRIKKEGLKDEVALQGWFTNKVNAHLKEKGKIMVGWNEILAADIIDRDIVAQYWTSKQDKNVNAHLKNGGKVILSCHKYFYFDMYYHYCTPEGTYKFNYRTAKVPDKLADGVLGVEGELWTEWVDTEKHLFFKYFNRSLALSETAWSADKVKNYKSFVKRMESHKKIMDSLGIHYGPDYLTMKKNIMKKSRLAKKNGFNAYDYDSEYRLSEIYKK